MKTKGISIKVAVDLAVTVVSFLLAAGVVKLDPATSAVVAKALGTFGGVLAPANDVRYDADPPEGQLG